MLNSRGDGYPLPFLHIAEDESLELKDKQVTEPDAPELDDRADELSPPGNSQVCEELELKELVALSRAKPGTTTAAVLPAMKNAATRVSSRFICVSMVGTPVKLSSRPTDPTERTPEPVG